MDLCKVCLGNIGCIRLLVLLAEVCSIPVFSGELERYSLHVNLGMRTELRGEEGIFLNTRNNINRLLPPTTVHSFIMWGEFLKSSSFLFQKQPLSKFVRVASMYAHLKPASRFLFLPYYACIFLNLFCFIIHSTPFFFPIIAPG